MKILTFRRLVLLAAAGGFAYVHKQRGGEWTLDSMKDTLRQLWSSASNKAESVKGEVREGVTRAARRAERSARDVLDDRNSRSTGYSRDDIERH